MDDKSTPEANDATNGDQTDHSQQGTGVTADDKGASTDVATKSDDKTDAGATGGGAEKTDKAPAKYDDDLDDWAEKRGYGKPETERERRLAQDARNNQRDYHKATDARKSADALSQTIANADPTKGTQGEPDPDDDPLEREIAGIKGDLLIERQNNQRLSFIQKNNVTPDEEAAMSAFLAEKVDKAPQAKKEQVFRYWSDPDNMDELRAIAKSRISSTTDSGEIVDQAKREERERLAKITASNGPDRSASATQTSSKTEDEARIERFKSGWRTGPQ
jgi:hypothetical protein